MTRSDSLSSFTVDLGPSLMTEVLSLIDNQSCFQKFNSRHTACEEEAAEEEEEDNDFLVFLASAVMVFSACSKWTESNKRYLLWSSSGNM